jgi:hypothetical protein
MISQRLLSSFVLTLLLLAPALAQTPEDQSPLNQQEKQEKALELKKEVERKTLSLLDEVIGSAVTLKNPENRALVLTGAADLLWTRDEKRARSLFKDALSNLNSIAIRFDEKMSDEQRTAYWKLAHQRKEILQIIARRDADMALELLHASRSQTAPTRAAINGSTQADEDLRLEESLTVQIAANDPKRALRMAEEGLSKGLSFELLNLLARLNEKDSELAERFASDIIGKLHSENLATNQEAAWLAAMLLRMGLRPEDGGGAIITPGSYIGVGKNPFRLNERQLSDLLEMVTAATLGSAPDMSLLSLLQDLMPQIEKHLPERVPALRSRIARFTLTLEPRERIFMEYRELIQHGSVEALMEAAAKTSDKTREMLYMEAGWKAFTSGDIERARQIISDNIKDSAERDRMLESFSQNAIWESMRKEKIDDVRQMLSHIKSKDERASILAQLALGAAVKKDRKLALELLDEARQFVNLKPKNDTQLYALLQVVRTYALVEPNKAFEMIESLVDQANDLLSAASVLSGFLLPPGMFRKGELMLPPGYSQVSMQFRQFGKELAALALVNFERTKAAADKFQRNETRIMARLFIAQGVLSEQLGSGLAQGGIVPGY